MMLDEFIFIFMIFLIIFVFIFIILDNEANRLIVNFIHYDDEYVIFIIKCYVFIHCVIIIFDVIIHVI